MHCASCREERLSESTRCAVCGGVMTRRTNEALIEELGHVRFVLADLQQWSRDDVSEAAQAWVRQRYRSRAEVLLRTLNGAAPVPTIPPDAPAERAPVPVAAPPVPVEDPATAGIWEAVADARLVAEPRRPRAVPERKPMPARVPRPEREGPSRWSAVWRPFLYESIGWFVGGFLILAGAFYFVADGWASALTRSLVVFGVCALYAMGFMLWSAFLRRRAALEASGRVVGVIGAALAPFPVLALQPVSEASASLGGGLTWAWSVVAAVLVRNLASGLDRPARTPLAVATMASTLTLGFAPWLAALGPAVAWLPLLPIACLGFVAMVPKAQEGPQAAAPRTLAFSLLAPLYLAAAMAVRLGLALHDAEASPAPGTWAALVSLAVAAALRALPAHRPRAATAVEIAAVSLQAAALAGAVFGDPPAFFTCAAALAYTGWLLARAAGTADLLRLRWLYVTFFAGLFAWHSSGQLVPGYLKALGREVKQWLGHEPAAPFPFNFGAVFTLPYLLVALLLALRLLESAGGDRRQRAVGELLLRASTVLAVLAAGLAFCGADLRAGLWSVPVASLALLAAGFWSERRFVTWAGAGLALLVPLYAVEAMDAGGVAMTACLVSLVLAVVSIVHRATERLVLSGASLVSSVIALAAALTVGEAMPAAFAAVAAAAAMLAGRNHDRTWLWSPALAVLVGALALGVGRAFVGFDALALGVLSVLVAASTLRGGRTLGALPVAAIAALCAALISVTDVRDAAHPGAVFLLASLALGLTGLRVKALHLLSAALGVLALLPANDVFSLWPGLTPTLSVGLLAMVSGATAVAAARFGRGVGAACWAACSLVGLTLAAGVSGSPSLALVAAVAGLLTMRALIPAVTLPWATGMALFAAVEAGFDGAVALICGLTFIGLLDESKSLRRHLFGGWRVGLTASICALSVAAGTVVLSAVLNEPIPLSLMAVLVGASLLWTRATRAWAFLLFPIPLLAVALMPHEGVETALHAVPLLLVFATRALGRWALGPDPVRGQWALVGSGAASMAVLLLAGAPGAFAITSALGLALSASRFAGPRIVAASLAASWIPQLGWAFALGMLAIGFATQHLPPLARGLVGAASDEDEEEGLSRWLGAAAVVSAVATFWASPGETAALTVSFAVLGATVLFGARWGVTASLVVAALAPFFELPHEVEREGLLLRVAAFALAASLSSLALTSEVVRNAVNRLRQRIAPLASPTASVRHPLWIAGALLVALLLMSAWALPQVHAGPGWLPLPVAVVSALAALALVWTRQAGLAVCGGGLLVLMVMAGAPFAWTPAVGAAMGMLLGVVGARVVPQTARMALRHLGWASSLLALVLLRDLGHAATPIAAACAMIAVWNATRGTRFEVLGWLAAWAALHVGLLFAGVRLSTGRGAQYILPYLGAASILLAGAATLWASQLARRWVVLALAVVGAVEICSAALLIRGVSPQEALVGAAALLVGCVLLMREALRWNDELAAWIAQLLLVAAYVTGRHLGTELQFGTGDSIVALVAGGIAAGLNGRLWKLNERWVALGRPLWGTGIVLPLVGLLAVPWESSGTGALLLLAHAAHFTLLARHRPLRHLGALLAFVAFNGALVFGWLETRALEPQYFAIPSALAVLLLVKVFEADLTLVAAARLRALAATVIHAAAAFRPLVFDSTVAMLACVAICVVGIAAGVVTRVRSFVYLGTGFLVTTVLANLIRHGVRDPRLGALFLSGLGLLIIVFMVLLSARRAELVERYDKLRHTLDTWQG